MKRFEFDKRELERYSRHMVLPQFGPKGQYKLKEASVLVVGAGGLGCPVLQYLTAAGIGKLGVLDFDLVSESNLQRQILYGTDDIGKPKSLQATKRLNQLNPFVEIAPIQQKITSANAFELLAPYQVIVDCTDNFQTRYLLNDACVLLDKPLVYGSIFRFEGQVSVFNFLQGPNYRDLYPVPPDAGSVPNCEEGGVLGVLPGIIGSLQANEVIKIVSGIGEILSGRLLLVDTLTTKTEMINFPNNNQRNLIEKLIDYDEFCGINKHQPNQNMKEITVEELKQLKEEGKDFQLIDVREEYELAICEIGGEHIPLAEIPHSVEKISRSKPVIIHCRSGGRSGNTVKWLEKHYQMDNLYNLKGGILAWADQIDPTLAKY